MSASHAKTLEIVMQIYSEIPLILSSMRFSDRTAMKQNLACFYYLL